MEIEEPMRSDEHVIYGDEILKLTNFNHELQILGLKKRRRLAAERCHPACFREKALNQVGISLFAVHLRNTHISKVGTKLPF
ncbi:unnamed protein product [Lactuca virosa]|uniref:Uncharacterized protein n=1 Tax=Lactuca virosa TaxID=75947 RepID=A0AAU9NZA1_9ASTR|nr:unnamed protein product [Lactuca virosa]